MLERAKRGINMNITIIGYGKMGRMIERIAKERGHNISAIIDPYATDATTTTMIHKTITTETINSTDVCIDFSTPESAINNIEKISALGKDVVVGTTGWYEDIDRVKSIIASSDNGIIYSGNFSIGMNLFIRIVANASKMFDKTDAYDPYIYELHHNQKRDSPSGTAEMIARAIIDNTKKQKMTAEILDRRINPEELHVVSVRAGNIPGTHVVGFDSAADTIELKHTARSREGFALGAVMAAEFIIGKKGVFTMDDLLEKY